MILIHESAEQIGSFKVESQSFVECGYRSMRRHDEVEESEKALRIFVGDARHGSLSLIKVSSLGCQWRKNVSERRMGSMCPIGIHHYNNAFSLNPLLARHLYGVHHYNLPHPMLGNTVSGCSNLFMFFSTASYPSCLMLLILSYRRKHTECFFRAHVHNQCTSKLSAVKPTAHVSLSQPLAR